MKSILFSLLIFAISFSANADCGLSGSLQDRINSCSENLLDLQLVMTKSSRKYWFSGKTKSVFQTVRATPWQAARDKCKTLVDELKLTDELLYEWDLARTQELTTSVIRAYPELQKLNSGSYYDETRYWLQDNFIHSTGKVWAYFYSTEGYLNAWFADASDAVYSGGICSVVLK